MRSAASPFSHKVIGQWSDHREDTLRHYVNAGFGDHPCPHDGFSTQRISLYSEITHYHEIIYCHWVKTNETTSMTDQSSAFKYNLKVFGIARSKPDFGDKSHKHGE